MTSFSVAAFPTPHAPRREIVWLVRKHALGSASVDSSKNTTNDLPSSDRPYHNPEADEIVCDGYAPLLAVACRYPTFLLF